MKAAIGSRASGAEKTVRTAKTSKSAKTSKAGEKNRSQRVNISIQPAYHGIPMFMAQEMGRFEDLGLEVEFSVVCIHLLGWCVV
jgi:ABC-type nitrate/sulfonate/bicarbonate transport system substrate-binding protein